jgi:hypothetical protein
MYDSLRKLLPDNLYDESAYHLANIFYNLALAFESINLGKIMRYEQPRQKKQVTGRLPPISVVFVEDTSPTNNSVLIQQ